MQVGGHNKYNKVFDVYFSILKALLRCIAGLRNNNTENRGINEQNVKFIMSTYLNSLLLRSFLFLATSYSIKRNKN